MTALACHECHGPMPARKDPKLRGRAKYCSAACQEASRRKKPQPVCLACAKTIVYMGRGRPRKYCNNACYLNHRKTNAR